MSNQDVYAKDMASPDVTAVSSSASEPIVIEPSTLDFEYCQCWRKTLLPLTITNVSDEDVTINHFDLMAPFSSNWNGGVIPANSSRVVTVIFEPTELNTVSQSLNIGYPGNNWGIPVSLSGTGIVAVANKLWAGVDLGLSVNWDDCNLEASAPEAVGGLYKWGETLPYYGDGWSHYSLCDGTQTSLTKYNTKADYGQVDNLMVLAPEDDAVRARKGVDWRMPTIEEMDELRTKCTWTATTQNGVKGYLVKSKTNDNSIFLPLTSDDECFYWTSSLWANTPTWAQCLSLVYPSGEGRGMYSRCNRYAIRAVCTNKDAGGNIITTGDDFDDPDDPGQPEDTPHSGPQLVVWQKDGSKVLFNLSERPQVTMGDDMVKVETVKISAEYAFEDVRKMTYDFSDPDAIKNVLFSDKPFSVADRAIAFFPSETDMNVSIVSANGMVVKELVVSKDEPTAVSLSGMTSGVYLVKVNGVTYKISIR